MTDRMAAPGAPDFGEDRAFQEKFWTVQRCAWVVFALIIAAALLGATGTGGPLANQEMQIGEVRVAAPRIARWASTADFKVRVGGGDGHLTLLLGPGFSRSFQIEDIQPRPDSASVGRDGQMLSFRAGGGTIAIRVRADRPGIASYAIGINGGGGETMRTLILP